MDFSKYPVSGEYYGGSEKKIGLIIDGNEYMIKFQKKTPFGVRNNHISEYLGSHIFGLLGYPVQETRLGCYKGEIVVACRNFVRPGDQFVPFNDVGESTLDQDKETYQYSYDDIMRMLRDNSKLTNVDATIFAFWELYIVDALIGNFDRHGSNWGFLKQNDQYTLAPVFDNGSCLFPNLTDEKEMEQIIASEEETNKRIFTFPTSQIRLHNRKSSYYDVISSLEYPECNRALITVYHRIDLSALDSLIGATEYISDVQKKFYHHMITERYHKIIKASYDALIERISDEGTIDTGNHLREG